jgi:hypothetical protein
VDARTLRLATVDRTDTAADGEVATVVGDGLTVASLSAADRMVAAKSLGLTGELSSRARIFRDDTRFRIELVLELRAIPDGTLSWTARCSEPMEGLLDAAPFVASCAGNGVLAWRAPDAVIGRTR